MTLNADDRKAAGAIARESLAAAVSGCSYEPADPGRPSLEERCGCFVTLKTKGQLRGCLGCFTSAQPLWRTVAEYTRLSAMEDPRFGHNRLKAAELPGVEMEVSALSPLRPCGDPERIRPGTDGIYVRSGGRSGCFLPQVATEMKWGVEEFWGHCCRDKAGLPWDAWRRVGTECFTFTADVFEV